MFDNIYGYTKVLANRGAIAEVKVTSPDEAKNVHDNYDIVMTIKTEVGDCIIIDSFPVSVDENDIYTVPSSMTLKLNGYYYIIFKLIDKSDGKIYYDKSRLIVSE
jgi:hypothetical protein